MASKFEIEAIEIEYFPEIKARFLQRSAASSLYSSIAIGLITSALTSKSLVPHQIFSTFSLLLQNLQNSENKTGLLALQSLTSDLQSHSLTFIQKAEALCSALSTTLNSESLSSIMQIIVQKLNSPKSDIDPNHFSNEVMQAVSEAFRVKIMVIKGQFLRTFTCVNENLIPVVALLEGLNNDFSFLLTAADKEIFKQNENFVDRASTIMNAEKLIIGKKCYSMNCKNKVVYTCKCKGAPTYMCADDLNNHLNKKIDHKGLRACWVNKKNLVGYIEYYKTCVKTIEGISIQAARFSHIALEKIKNTYKDFLKEMNRVKNFYMDLDRVLISERAYPSDIDFADRVSFEQMFQSNLRFLSKDFTQALNESIDLIKTYDRVIIPPRKFDKNILDHNSDEILSHALLVSGVYYAIYPLNTSTFCFTCKSEKNPNTFLQVGCSTTCWICNECRFKNIESCINCHYGYNDEEQLILLQMMQML